MGYAAFGKCWPGLVTPRMWTNLVQQADIFLVLGEMTQQDNYIHMEAAFNFLQDCPLRHHGDRDGRFP